MRKHHCGQLVEILRRQGASTCLGFWDVWEALLRVKRWTHSYLGEFYKLLGIVWGLEYAARFALVDLVLWCVTILIEVFLHFILFDDYVLLEQVATLLLT